MTREEKIQWLVTNRQEWAGEEGSEILNALSPTRIDTLFEKSQAATYCEAVTNAVVQGFTDGNKHYRFDPEADQFVVNMCDESHVEYSDEEDEEEDEVPRKKKAPPDMATNSERITLNQMYERGDDQVRAMISDWKEADNRARHEALVKLTTNCRSDEAKKVATATYSRLSTKELQHLAANAVPPAQDYFQGEPRPTPPSYLGAGGPPPSVTQNHDTSDILPLPQTDYAPAASTRLLERVGRNGK